MTLLYYIDSHSSTLSSCMWGCCVGLSAEYTRLVSLILVASTDTTSRMGEVCSLWLPVLDKSTIRCELALQEKGVGGGACALF